MAPSARARAGPEARRSPRWSVRFCWSSSRGLSSVGVLGSGSVVLGSGGVVLGNVVVAAAVVAAAVVADVVFFLREGWEYLN